MKSNNALIYIILVTSVFLTSCGKKDKSSTTSELNDVIPVEIISLKKSDVTKPVYASGQFTTDDETMLSFKTGGVINKIYIKEGDRVSKGQLLATLNLTEISTFVNQAQIGVEKAKRDYQRAENLFRDSVATLEQLQNAKTGFEIAEQQLEGSRFNLSYSEIRATNDGVILRKLANEGQIVGSGMPVIQTSSKGKADWILRVAVSDKEWAGVSLNDKAKVTIVAVNLDNIDGFVYSKSENADPMTGSFTLDIKLINAKKLNIASGMFGKAEIYVSHSENVWQIPYESLLDGNANDGFVFVTNDNKKAIRVPVKIYSINKDSVSVSEGLTDYTSLIISGSAYLTNGSAIKVVKN